MMRVKTNCLRTKNSRASGCKGRRIASTMSNATLTQRLKKNSSGKTAGGVSYAEQERFDPSKPFHPGPLKLEIKSIKNSTRTDTGDNDLILNHGNGRGFLTVAVLFSWILGWSWKALWSYVIVNGIDWIWSSIKYRLGFGKDHYVTTLTLGDKHKGVGISLKHDLDHHHHHGWRPHHGFDHKKWVYKTSDPWYHPASKLFKQPTYQYNPHGMHYTLLGYDQHKALKYRKKYNKKFHKYKAKHYRQKYHQYKKGNRYKGKGGWGKKGDRRKKVKDMWSKFKDKFRFKKKHQHDDDDDESWEGSSSDVEHGYPPNAHYSPSSDYDPLPGGGGNQNFFRIDI